MCLSYGLFESIRRISHTRGKKSSIWDKKDISFTDAWIDVESKQIIRNEMKKNIEITIRGMKFPNSMNSEENHLK